MECGECGDEAEEGVLEQDCGVDRQFELQQLMNEQIIISIGRSHVLRSCQIFLAFLGNVGR